MGRGKATSETGALSAVPAPPPGARASSSGKWDEISRSLKQRDIFHPGLPGNKAPLQELEMTELLTALRASVPDSERRAKYVWHTAERLTEEMKVEHPDLADIREVLPFVDTPTAHIWADARFCFKRNIPKVLDPLPNREDKTLELEALRDMARIGLMQRCLHHVPKLMGDAFGGPYFPATADASTLLAPQLPDPDHEIPVDHPPFRQTLTTLAENMGYADLFEICGQLPLTSWEDIYREEMEPEVEWMRPDPDVPFTRRYRMRFARALHDALSNGMVPERQ